MERYTQLEGQKWVSNCSPAQNFFSFLFEIAFLLHSESYLYNVHSHLRGEIIKVL